MIEFSQDELKQAEIEAKKYLLDLSNEKKKSAILAIRDLQDEPFCKN